MRCEIAQRWISDWLDNRLSPEQQAQLQEHLNGCSMCRQRREEWLRLREVLRSYPNIAPRADFEVQVRQTVSQARRTVRWNPSPALRLVFSGAVGAAIALALIITLWLQGPSKPTIPLIVGGREAVEWVQLLWQTEGGEASWHGGSSPRSFLPCCLWWRS